jgi:hypothetical protein
VGVEEAASEASTAAAAAVLMGMETGRSPELKLAIGTVDENYESELAVEYSSRVAASHNKVMVESLTAQPNADRSRSTGGSATRTRRTRWARNSGRRW